MFCEICNKNPAKIHITQVKNSQKYTIHICHVCAHEKGVAGPAVNTTFSVDQLLSGFVQVKEAVTSEPGTNQTCPSCGLSYGAFKESGRLGCAVCYNTFTEHLQPLLRKIQKSVLHSGKTPRDGGGKLAIRRNISDLRLRLKDAVSQEHFELAARLRDQIREMESQMNQAEEF